MSIDAVVWRVGDAGDVVVGRTPVLRQESTAGALTLDSSYGVQWDVPVSGGALHRVGIEVRLVYRHASRALDFGSPGSGRGVWFDSIEVCLEEPLESLTRRVTAIEDRDLELRLYQRECVPTVWLPEARGGRLERARSLTGELLDAAVASGATGVNERVARMRLESADADIASGDYQRACRSLSEAVRSLTTP